MPFQKIMDEFEAGTLHSGSSKGPLVKNKAQALAIGLKYARQEGKKKKKAGDGDDTSSKHPGFAAVASKIAQEPGVSAKGARAILAARSRGASVSAKKANPRLNRVLGG